VRSGKNAIIKAGRRESRRQVRAPKRGKGRGMGKARGNRSVQDAIAVDCRWTRALTCKYHLLAVLVDRHLDCQQRCRFWREQRLATAIDRKRQKKRRPVI